MQLWASAARDSTEAFCLDNSFSSGTERFLCVCVFLMYAVADDTALVPLFTSGFRTHRFIPVPFSHNIHVIRFGDGIVQGVYISGCGGYPGVSRGSIYIYTTPVAMGTRKQCILIIQFQLELGTLRQLIQLPPASVTVPRQAVARPGGRFRQAAGCSRRQLQPVLAGYCWSIGSEGWGDRPRQLMSMGRRL